MASVKQGFRIDGLKELQAALLELPKATQGNVLKRAVAAPAADFAEEAARIAPSPGKYGEGILKTEIKVSKPKIISPGKAAYAQAMSSGATKAEAAQAARNANRAAGGTGKAVITHAGPTRKAFYGQFLEFGTSRIAAKPFMRPTWDRMGRQMIDSVADTLRVEIAKARKRFARKAEREAAKMRAGK
jgi:HK97 gp10 family phage protein